MSFFSEHCVWFWVKIFLRFFILNSFSLCQTKSSFSEFSFSSPKKHSCSFLVFSEFLILSETVWIQKRKKSMAHEQPEVRSLRRKMQSFLTTNQMYMLSFSTTFYFSKGVTKKFFCDVVPIAGWKSPKIPYFWNFAQKPHALLGLGLKKFINCI